MTGEQFLQEIKDLKDGDYLADSTRAIIVSFTSYHAPTEYFTQVTGLIEQSASGFIVPTYLQIIPFKPWLENSSNGFVSILILRGLFLIFALITILATLVSNLT